MRDITEIFDTRATLTQKRAYALLYTKLGKYTNLVTQSRLLSFHLKGALLKHERHTAKYNTAFQKKTETHCTVLCMSTMNATYAIGNIRKQDDKT